MKPDITTVRIEKRQNRAQILAFAFQESLEEGLFCRSPVVNEVVLGTPVNKVVSAPAGACGRPLLGAGATKPLRHRSRRKNARTSATRRSGASIAGKCPPSSNSEKWAILPSGFMRRLIIGSVLKTAHPCGAVDGVSQSSWLWAPS